MRPNHSLKMLMLFPVPLVLLAQLFLGAPLAALYGVEEGVYSIVQPTSANAANYANLRLDWTTAVAGTRSIGQLRGRVPPPFLNPRRPLLPPRYRHGGRSGTLLRMERRFERYFAGTNSISKVEWVRALPNEDEKLEMKKLIHRLYALPNFRSRAVLARILSQFPAIREQLKLSLIGTCYLVVHERVPFPRHWGYIALASPECLHRPYLHHSAPHFKTDGDVCAQAVVLFERTNSRSLVVAGASRYAVRGNATSDCQPPNALADAAHNTATMFHQWLEALWEVSRWLDDRVGGKRSVFIQWHGMGNVTCPRTAAYLSVGAPGSNHIYALVNTPINRLVRAVNRQYGGGARVATTPATNPSCSLKATNNVFGRLMNGVPERNLCRGRSAERNVTGRFIHIEQQYEPGSNWTMWTRALTEAFPRTGE